jgi:hypothetical protein
MTKIKGFTEIAERVSTNSPFQGVYYTNEKQDGKSPTISASCNALQRQLVIL